MKYIRRLLPLISLAAAAPALCPANPQVRNDVAESNAKALFEYLLTPRTDIGADRIAQDAWLTPDLKWEIMVAKTSVLDARRAAKEELGPDPSEPSNATFLNAWDPPTACVVTSSKPFRNDYLVFVYCGWSDRTNYPGSNGHYALTMKQIGEAWLVNDIRFSVNGEGESTLVDELRNTVAEAKAIQTSGHR